VDVEFEQVEERVGQGDGAVQGAGAGVGKGEWRGGFGAEGEGDILEVAVRVGYVFACFAVVCMLARTLDEEAHARESGREWGITMAYIVRLRHVTGTLSLLCQGWSCGDSVFVIARIVDVKSVQGRKRTGCAFILAEGLNVQLLVPHWNLQGQAMTTGPDF
jgi:hypothetical protein